MKKTYLIISALLVMCTLASCAFFDSTCDFARTGYVFAGWSESSYGSTVKYADGATINREWDDDNWDGSTDGETYNLYANWTESKSPEQQEAEEKLAAGTAERETRLKVAEAAVADREKEAADLRKLLEKATEAEKKAKAPLASILLSLL